MNTATSNRIFHWRLSLRPKVCHPFFGSFERNSIIASPHLQVELTVWSAQRRSILWLVSNSCALTTGPQKSARFRFSQLTFLYISRCREMQGWVKRVGYVLFLASSSGALFLLKAKEPHTLSCFIVLQQPKFNERTSIRIKKNNSFPVNQHLAQQRQLRSCLGSGPEDSNRILSQVFEGAHDQWHFCCFRNRGFFVWVEWGASESVESNCLKNVSGP